MQITRDVLLIFSERIKYLREEAGLTQATLSNKMTEKGYGITENMISGLERCRSEPSITQIEAFCKYFDVTPNFLLGYEQEIKNNKMNIKNCDLLISLKKQGITKEKLFDSHKNLEDLLNLINELYG